jgi:hypothetical protein
MISCNLIGGLGNQLFQIFTTISYAIQNRRPFSFFSELDDYSKNITKRRTYWNSFLNRLTPYINNKSSHNVVYKEIGFNYNSIPFLNRNQKPLLSGYFQSPKYFQDNFMTIIQLIGYKEIAENVKNKYTQYSFEENTISMHFRRGDYKKLPDFHPILSNEFYEKTLAYILNHSLNAEKYIVYYFCEKEDYDEILLVIQSLENTYKEKIEDWEQMVIMSLCNHHIIANSTFSWWGAYFSKALNIHNSITCYPSVWFGPNLRHYYMEDLFPKEWIKIE